MSFASDVGSVVGQGTSAKWGQVLISPNAYAVIEVETSDANARQKGVALLTELTNAFDEMEPSLAPLIGLRNRLITDEVKSLILLVPKGKTLYIVTHGKGKVFLRRGDKLAILIEGSGELSGTVVPGDSVIAASVGFVQAIGPKEILNTFNQHTSSMAAEKLTIMLQAQTGGEGAAALIFTIVNPVQSMLSAGETQPISKKARSTPNRFIVFFKRGTNIRRIISPKRLLSVLRHPKKMLQRKFIVPTVFLALFVGSVFYGVFHQKKSLAQTKTSEILVEAQHDFDEGMALLDLNPVKGRERLTAAKELLGPMVSKNAKTEEAKQAKLLYDQVLENLRRAMHIAEVTPQLFFDVSLLKNGSTVTRMAFFEDTFGFLDGTNNTVFSLKATSKNGQIVGGGEGFGGSTLISQDGVDFFVLTPEGVQMITVSNQKVSPNIIPKHEIDWGVITDMSAFGGNVYLLDTQKSRIWKYVALDAGFSELREYLNPDVLPDLTGAINMVIDGSVWLGTNKGKILRFTSGKENPYIPQGVEPALGSMQFVYVSDIDKYVYVYDVSNSRVVVLDKDGLYLSQYKFPTSFHPTQMVAAEKLAKLFLLADGKIYTIDLK